MKESKDKRVFVVMPAYNEAAVIRDSVSPLLQYNYQVVVIDDGSTDETKTILSGLPIHYLCHTINLGQGAALQTGIEYCQSQGADYIVTFDADGQHSPEDIARLLLPLEADQADVALGSRFMEEKLTIPKTRRILLKIAIWFSNISMGTKYTDVHNGLRAFNAKAASQIRITQNRMAHATEILAQIHRLGLRCVEVPVQISYNAYSQKKGQKTVDFIDILIDLIFGG